MTPHLNIKFDHDAIHVFCCRYDRVDEPQLLTQYQSLLNQEERQRWERMRTDNLKLCFLISRSMIRTLLGAAIGCSPSALTISTKTQGKPFIEQPTTRWQFNLSHTQGLVVLVLAYDTDVGVDIECHLRKTDILQLARHCFHSREVQQLEALPADQQRQHFFKLWTLKEAYIKALGHGLSHPLDSFGFTFHQSNSSFAMHPPPAITLNCWSAQPELDYTLAIIALSQTPATQSLKLQDYLPYHFCEPKQFDCLIHSVIAPN